MWNLKEQTFITVHKKNKYKIYIKELGQEFPFMQLLQKLRQDNKLAIYIYINQNKKIL